MRTLPVPGYRQARNYCCGFSAVLMVLRYFEQPLAGIELYSALGTTPQGTSQKDIVDLLRSQELSASLRYDMNFNSLRRWIDQGKICIGYLGDEEHWIVLYGYGVGPNRIFVADPEPGKTCEHLWSKYGHRLGGFAMLCSPKATKQVRQGTAPEQAHPVGEKPQEEAQTRRDGQLVLPFAAEGA